MVATVAALQDEVNALREQLVQRDAKIAQLNDLLKQVLQREFGTASEKMPPEQARLFDEQDCEETADPAPIRVQGHERQPRRRPRLSPDLPRVEVVHDLSDAEKICAEHGCALAPLSEVTSEQLEFQPAKLYVLRHIQKTYTCPCCTGQVVTAAKPPSLLPKSLATPSLLAWITASKFCDGLPLYRQSAIFARLGVTLDRTTMAQWMIRVGEQVQPLVNLLWDRLRAQRIVHMDETTVQVLDEPGRTPQSKSYMWVTTAGPPRAGIVLFHYAPSRGGQVAKNLLGDHQGALMVDGYEGYNGVCGNGEILRLGCWAHARRKFVVAQRAQPKGKTGAADQALALIAKLYRVERTQAEAEDPDRYRARQAQAAPVLKQLRAFLDRNQARTAPQTALGKALTYLDNQWAHLVRYLEDGAYPIDNNRAENAIRPFVIGRKNFLFSQSIPGVRANANLYSLIETAKAHGLDPHAYLRQVFERLTQVQSVEDFEPLLPGAVKNGV
jgi:transposase